MKNTDTTVSSVGEHDNRLPTPPAKKRTKPIKKQSSTPLTTSTLTNNEPPPIHQTTYLMIVESPSKCKIIETYLGNQWRCIATRGHLREIANLKSIDVKHDYNVTYSIKTALEPHIKMMKSVITQYDPQNIYLATDDDREGEAIAWHVCDMFNLQPETTKRIIFHEITKDAIMSSLEHPTVINNNIILSQKSRLILDIFIGLRVSSMLSKFITGEEKDIFSAGRCQTPALRLVYDHFIQQQNHYDKPTTDAVVNYPANSPCSADNCLRRTSSCQTNEKTPHIKYNTTAYFFAENLPFQLCDPTEFTTENDVVAFLEKSKTYKYTLTAPQPTTTDNTSLRRSPPQPFNTSKLLQTANHLLNISPKQIMQGCQQLYQEGHITYMRTTNNKYSSVFLKKATDYITQKWNAKYVGDTAKITNMNGGEPHEAVRVTNLELCHINTKDRKLNALYELIWRNTLESCMADEIYKKITHHITATTPTTGATEATYKNTLEIPIFMGWKTAGKTPQAIHAEKLNGTVTYLQMLCNQNPQPPLTPRSICCKTAVQDKPAPHYTESSLIKKLEDLGIGRPSTFSMLVETIKDRNYVKKTNIEGVKINTNDYVLSDNIITKQSKELIYGEEKNKLVIQPLGITVIEFLTEHFNSLFSYEYTKHMEDELDNISNGTTSPWYDICRKCNQQIKDMSMDLKAIVKQTIPINDDYDLVSRKHGFVLKHKNGEYKSIKKNMILDLNKLKNREYTFDDLVEIKNDVLGVLNGEEVTIKSGKYGAFVEHNGVKKNISKINSDINKITMEDAVAVLSDNTRHFAMSKNTMRIINTDICIKRGRFGAYVYYKTENMHEPKFISLTKFKKGFMKCEAEELLQWLRDTHQLDV